MGKKYIIPPPLYLFLIFNFLFAHIFWFFIFLFWLLLVNMILHFGFIKEVIKCWLPRADNFTSQNNQTFDKNNFLVFAPNMTILTWTIIYQMKNNDSFHQEQNVNIKMLKCSWWLNYKFYNNFFGFQTWQFK